MPDVIEYSESQLEMIMDSYALAFVGRINRWLNIPVDLPEMLPQMTKRDAECLNQLAKAMGGVNYSGNFLNFFGSIRGG